MSQGPPNSALPLPALLEFNANDTVGVLYIVAVISAFLAGITSLQTYVYYQHPYSERDSRLFRAVIFFLWMLDMLHAAFVSHASYVYNVTYYGDPLELLKPCWMSLSWDSILGSLSNTIVTWIVMTRIWRLSQRKWPMVIFIAAVTVLVICSDAASLGVAIVSLIVTTYEEFNIKYSWIYYSWFGIRAIIDFTTAITLAFMLTGYRTTFKTTSHILRLLVMYCVNTGALTSATSIAVIITYATKPNTYISFSLAVLLPKFMLNSMLSLVNSRHTIRDNNAGVVSIHLSRLQLSDATTPSDDLERQVVGRRIHEAIDSDFPSGDKPTKPNAVVVLA